MSAFNALYDDWLGVSKHALSGCYTPSDFVADSVSIWTNAFGALPACVPGGFAQACHQGLDFFIDDDTESVGPQFIAVPAWAASLTAVPRATAVTPLGPVPVKPLTPDNVMARLELGQFSVTLVNLGPLRPDASGSAAGVYQVTFGGVAANTVTLMVTLSDCC